MKVLEMKIITAQVFHTQFRMSHEYLQELTLCDYLKETVAWQIA